MTEEEKKEFEEFLQWKKEKAERELAEKKSTDKDDKEELNKDISSEASKPESANGFYVIAVFIVLAVIFIAIILLSLNIKNNPVPPIEEEEDSVEVVEPDISEPVTKTWDFSIQKDEMLDSKNIWATIKSDNYISQDFPYEGYTYASITVRYMKKYGYDVIISISKGQINGRSYSGTDYITARFDDGTAKKYYFNEAADGSSEMVFLRNQSDFIKRCKQAKDIKIDIPIYKGGRPVFTFNVDEPLVWREE